MQRPTRAAVEQVWVEESFPEGRVAARVPMGRDSRTGELVYTATALRTLDRLRALLQQAGELSTPGHLRSLREALGLTQQEMASKLAVSMQTVSRWERGESRPRSSALGRLRTLQRSTRRHGIAKPQPAGLTR